MRGSADGIRVETRNENDRGGARGITLSNLSCSYEINTLHAKHVKMLCISEL